MKLLRKLIIAVAVCLASGIAASAQSDGAADLPYTGTWKLNLARSDFGETTVMYAQTASGEMKFTAMGQSYTFQMDGKDYPSLFGVTSAWKQIDGMTWEIAIKQDGKLINTTTTTLSADGKTTFHLVALGDNGKVLLKKKFTQKQLITFTANLQTSLIGMEACSGAHFLGRALRAQGHEVKLIPAQFVNPFVKSNKNDFIDAEAIAEAARPAQHAVCSDQDR